MISPKKILLVLISFCFLLGLSAQELHKPAPTTEEEYNFCTKGYKIQIESGLDMKKGYSLGEVGEVNEGPYRFTFKLLIRKESNEMAAIMVIAKSSGWGNVYYLCIPNDNDDLNRKYKSFLDQWDGSICRAYSKALSDQLSKILAIATEMEKKLKPKK